MATVVTLGELMLRLKSPARERLLQSPVLEATFGGSEANVAVSLARFGIDAAFVTALPANAIGDAAVAELRRFGVDVGNVIRCGNRVGTYFLEAGANQRRAKVLYDRAGSSIAEADPKAFDWSAILAGATWLHVSAITPALSERAASLTLAACRQAKQSGATVSCDFNYREKLWQYGRSAPEVMAPIVELVDVGIGNANNCSKSLGIAHDVPPGSFELEAYRALGRRVMERFPGLATLAITIRKIHSAERNELSACLVSDGELIQGPRYEMADIVDRVGAGDAFAAGLIHGLTHYESKAKALEFATAAGCLKHTIPGDFNRVSADEVEALMAGQTSGIVQR